jgi:Xaa-Pro aminopeptidase
LILSAPQPTTTVADPAALRARRERVAAAIGSDGLALVAGAAAPDRSERFRQTNEFFHLTGLEAPGAYVLIDGAGGETTIYLPPRDAHRERTDGPSLSADDPDAVRAVTGAEHVFPVAQLGGEIGRRLFRGRVVLHTPASPAEATRASRDALLGGRAARVGDAFRAYASDEHALRAALTSTFPSLEIRDLTPVLDGLRLVKSETELAALREAGRLTALAAAEAMRSTRPGVREYELAAVADFVFAQAGASGGSYEAIVATGTNAWHGHYVAKRSELRDGELVLYDYAPDLTYYTSDIGRMWPVTGRWESWQLELYEFILRYHRALLERIAPGATAAEILDDAAAEMAEVFAATTWSAPEFERAARGALEFRGHLSHPVGMAVHDVGEYRHEPLREGLVFSVDPMLWVPERRLYVRCEDTVAVTATGIENLTSAAPLDPEEIVATMAEPGLLQAWTER